jgi:hypothetical protein
LGGFHFSGSLSMLGGITPEIQQAEDLGISLFAGEGEEGRLDEVLRDAGNGTLKPLVRDRGAPGMLGVGKV